MTEPTAGPVIEKGSQTKTNSPMTVPYLLTMSLRASAVLRIRSNLFLSHLITNRCRQLKTKSGSKMSMKMVSTIMQITTVVLRSMPIEYPNAIQAARPNMISMAVIAMKIWESSGKRSSSAPSQKAYINARAIPVSKRRPSELVRRVAFNWFFC